VARWHIPLRVAAGSALLVAALCLPVIAVAGAAEGPGPWRLPRGDLAAPAAEPAGRADVAQRPTRKAGQARQPRQAQKPAQAREPQPKPFAELREFTIYDATLLKRKPAPTLAPMKHLVMLYEWGPNDTGLWATGQKEGVPSRDRIARLLKSVKPGTPVVLDIERWFKDTDDEDVWRDTYAKLRETVDHLKAARPDLPVACFNAAPWGVRAALTGHKPDVAKVETQMRLLTAPGGLNEAVDFYADGVYASKKLGAEDWERWIRWRAAELKRLDKPMHLVLNPYFSGTADLVPAAYWDAQMRVAREVASSVIVWTDYVPTFNRADHWYQSVLDGD
jgi:hypothetical protein